MEKSKLNWRGYLKEYAIIVVGVLTALAAQQIAEWWQWRNQVAQAREQIATELQDTLVGAISRVRTKACAEQRLASLALTLDAAAKTGTLPPVGDINLPPRVNWPTGTWDSIVASQTATHFPRQQLAALGTIYKMSQRLEYFSGQEVEAWSSLFAMVGPGRRLDPASEADLRKALSQSLTYSRIMSNLSLTLITRIHAHPLPFTREALDRIAAEKNLDLKAYPICGPFGAVPPSYGQAFNLLTFDARSKHLPDFTAGAGQ